MNLTFSHFEEILKKGYNLDIVFLLTLVDEQECDIKELCCENPKLSLLYQTLIRKGLVTEECKLTLEGKSLIDFLSSPIESKIDKKKPVPMILNCGGKPIQALIHSHIMVKHSRVHVL